jgi:hypothetical protein
MKTSSLPPSERATLRKLLEKELQCGALRVADPREVAALTPIHVVKSGAASKPRLIHDLRPINAWLKPPCRTEFERVRDALALGVAYGTKIDLMNAFKHVQVDPKDRKWLAFAVDDTVFQWTTLPFGLSWSPTLFQRALQPTIDKLRGEGVKIVVYMDDIFVGANSAEELDEHTARTITVLSEDGWSVAKDKVYPWAHEKLRFLGLLVDLESRKLRVPKSKARKLEELCKAAVECPSGRVALPSLQKIVGLLAFFIAAAPFVALSWRGLLGAMTEAESLPGRHVWVRGRLQQELRFWQLKAMELPEAAGICYSDRSAVIVSDASDTGAGALVWESRVEAPDLQEWAAGRIISHPSLRNFALPPAAQTHSSSDRELLALEFTLQQLVEALKTRESGKTEATTGFLTLLAP